MPLAIRGVLYHKSAAQGAAQGAADAKPKCRGDYGADEIQTAPLTAPPLRGRIPQLIRALLTGLKKIILFIFLKFHLMPNFLKQTTHFGNILFVMDRFTCQ